MNQLADQIRWDISSRENRAVFMRRWRRRRRLLIPQVLRRSGQTFQRLIGDAAVANTSDMVAAGNIVKQRDYDCDDDVERSLFPHHGWLACMRVCKLVGGIPFPGPNWLPLRINIMFHSRRSIRRRSRITGIFANFFFRPAPAFSPPHGSLIILMLIALPMNEWKLLLFDHNWSPAAAVCVNQSRISMRIYYCHSGKSSSSNIRKSIRHKCVDKEKYLLPPRSANLFLAAHFASQMEKCDG